MNDLINHPSHYAREGGKHECIEVLKEWMPKESYLGFLRGNAIKYLCRAGKKNNEAEDLQKAQFYINRLVEEVKNERLK